MRKYYFLILFLTTICNAQTFNWAKTQAIVYSLNPDMISYSTVADATGNVYFMGYKDTYYSGGTEMYGNVFYNKYDSAGTLLFSKTFTGKINFTNAVADSSGNILLAVSFITTATVGTTTFTGSGTTRRPLLLKLDSNGELIWSKELMTINSSASHFGALAIDLADNVYIGYDNFNYSYITKMSPLGAVLSSITQQNVQVISALAVDNTGNIYSCGSCAKNNSIFAGVPQVAPFTYTDYVTKYNSNNVHQWTKFIEDVTCIDPKVVAKTADAVYISSTLSGAYSFDTISAAGPFSSTDFFIAKLNENGIFQWVREVPGNTQGKAAIGKRSNLALDNSGNIYFAGKVYLNIAWSPTVSTSISGFNSDMMLLKYNPDGEIVFAKTAGGSYSDIWDAVSIANDGSIYLSGLAGTTATFDGFQLTGSDFPVLAKIGSVLSTENNEFASNYIYPNPVEGKIYFSKSIENQIITIYNNLGQIVKVENIIENQSLNVEELRAGIYFLKTNNYAIMKFVKL